MVMVLFGEILLIRYMVKVGNKKSDVLCGVVDRFDCSFIVFLCVKGVEVVKNNFMCDVLIVDCLFDVIMFVVYEWMYESMVTDLLNVSNGVY